MIWTDWLIAAWFCLGILTTVGSVNQPRQRITPGIAVGVVAISGGILALLLVTHLGG